MAAVDASAAVVLLDLDDTLLYEQRTVPGILVKAARLSERRRGVPASERRRGVPATELAAALRHCARRRWRALRCTRSPWRWESVGNSLEHDVAGARAAGMRAVWFAYEEVPGVAPAATPGVPPDHVIRSLAELLTLPAVRSARR